MTVERKFFPRKETPKQNGAKGRGKEKTHNKYAATQRTRFDKNERAQFKPENQGSEELEIERDRVWSRDVDIPLRCIPHSRAFGIVKKNKERRQKSKKQ